MMRGAHIDDADGEQESMTLTKVRFQMIHQFLKNTSALAAARSSHENNHPEILAQATLNKEIAAEQLTINNVGHVVFLN